MCKHHKAAHTWIFNGGQPDAVVDCGFPLGYYADELGTVEEQICPCPKFVEPDPLTLCEKLEESLYNGKRK